MTKHIHIDILLTRICRKYSAEFVIGLYEDVILSDNGADNKIYLKRLMRIINKYKETRI